MTLFLSVQELKEEIEIDIGVPAEDQILMTDYGKLVKNDNLPQILQSVGKVRSSLLVTKQPKIDTHVHFSFL